MIVRQEHGDTLMDASSLARLTGRQRATIRAHSQPIACDIRTRRTLYSALAAIEAVATIPTRACRNHAA